VLSAKLLKDNKAVVNVVINNVFMLFSEFYNS
jgi:hypothetical protein